MCDSYFDYDSFIGNFIDTANFYHYGDSEEWLGEFIKKRGNRDNLVSLLKSIIYNFSQITL